MNLKTSVKKEGFQSLAKKRLRKKKKLHSEKAQARLPLARKIVKALGFSELISTDFKSIIAKFLKELLQTIDPSLSKSISDKVLNELLAVLQSIPRYKTPSERIALILSRTLSTNDLRILQACAAWGTGMSALEKLKTELPYELLNGFNIFIKPFKRDVYLETLSTLPSLKILQEHFENTYSELEATNKPSKTKERIHRLWERVQFIVTNDPRTQKSIAEAIGKIILLKPIQKPHHLKGFLKSKAQLIENDRADDLIKEIKLFEKTRLARAKEMQGSWKSTKSMASELAPDESVIVKIKAIIARYLKSILVVLDHSITPSQANEIVDELLKSVFSIPEYVPLMQVIALVANSTFSAKELKAASKFLKTSIGKNFVQKLITKLPLEIVREISEATEPLTKEGFKNSLLESSAFQSLLSRLESILKERTEFNPETRFGVNVPEGGFSQAILKEDLLKSIPRSKLEKV